MDTIDAIYQRRSIREFKADKVPRELIEMLLAAATKAPSAMNKQPWRFVILEGTKKDELIELFRKKITRTKKYIKSAGYAEATANSMKQAPVLILVFNTESKANGLFKIFSSAMDVLNIQSIGGAVQTLILVAQELGLGSLWIGHIFYASREICKFANKNEELIAAISIGYANESPGPRPRNEWTEITEWL